MDNYTLTPLEMLVITQYVTLMHLCNLLIAISLIQVTAINLFSTIISLFWASKTLCILLGKQLVNPLNYVIKTIVKKSI